MIGTTIAFFWRGRLCSSKGGGRLCHGTMASPSLVWNQNSRTHTTTGRIKET